MKSSLHLRGNKPKPKPPEFKPVTTAKIDVMDVGSGTTGVARKAFPNANIFSVDANSEVKADLHHDITQPFPADYEMSFDVVFASHIIEHISRLNILPVIRNLKACLRYGGVLWIVTPSLEWVARQLLTDNPSPAVLPILYGGEEHEWDRHLSGFTMVMLRQVMQMAGLAVRDAFEGSFVVQFGKNQVEATHNIIVAMRPQEKPSQEKPSE